MVEEVLGGRIVAPTFATSIGGRVLDWAVVSTAIFGRVHEATALSGWEAAHHRPFRLRFYRQNEIVMVQQRRVPRAFPRTAPPLPSRERPAVGNDLSDDATNKKQLESAYYSVVSDVDCFMRAV